jgi:hypothetical protein
MLESFKKISFCRLRRAGSSGLNAGPAGDQFVVGAGVFGLAKAFAEGVEAVGELAHGFGFAAESGEQRADIANYEEVRAQAAAWVPSFRPRSALLQVLVLH